MVVLRIIHIFAGIYWVGSGFFMFFIVAPTARKLRSGQLMQTILVDSPFSMVIAASAGVTVLAGIPALCPCL